MDLFGRIKIVTFIVFLLIASFCIGFYGIQSKNVQTLAGPLEDVICFFQSTLLDNTCLYSLETEDLLGFEPKRTVYTANTGVFADSFFCFIESFFLKTSCDEQTIVAEEKASAPVTVFSTRDNERYDELLQEQERLRNELEAQKQAVTNTYTVTERETIRELQPVIQQIADIQALTSLSIGKTLTFSALDCSGYAGEGKLTTDENGKVICANDHIGGGSANTDEQALSFNTTTYALSIGNGNTVDLSALANTATSTLEGLADVASFTQNTGDLIYWNGTQWTNIATSSLGLGGSSGTVSSVALSAPTGFTVSGSPITTTGTLALGLATGYTLPLTASTTQWHTAFGWGDHSVQNYFDTDTDDTDNLTEGSNLFYTNARVSQYIAGSSTISRLGQSIAASELLANTNTAGYVLQASSTATGGFAWVATSTLNISGGSSSLFTDNANTTYLTSSDFLGIGTSTALSKLSIYGNALLEGTNRYLNFGTATGSVGYGFRDNAGTLEFKNADGDWTGVGSGGTTQYGLLEDEWEDTGATLPGNLGMSQTAIIGDYVYLFGGFNGSPTDVIYRAPVSDPTDWEDTGASLPSTVYHAQLAIIDDSVYLFGHGDYIYRASTSDPTDWEDTGATLPTNVSQSQLAIIDDFIYLFGRNSDSDIIYRASTSDPTDWEDTGATLPSTGLTQSQVAVIGNYLYLFGGYNGSVVVDDIYRAPVSDPTDWEDTGATLPSTQYRSMLTVIGDYIYLFGGNGSSDTIYRAPVSNPTNWEDTGSVLPGSVQLSQTAIIGDYVYLFGGFNGSYLDIIYRAPIYTHAPNFVNNKSWKVQGNNGTGSGGSGTNVTLGTDNQIPFTNAGGTDFDYSNLFTFTGTTLTAPTTTLSGLLTMSGSVANIALGSNWLSGDGNDEGIFVDGDGNVGIGTSTPLSKLSVYGDAFLEGANRYFNFGTATGSAGYGFRDNGGTLEFKNSGGTWQSVTTATSGPSFSVHRNGVDQTVSAATITLINWTTERFDTNNDFDLSVDRFTPTVPGKYVVTLQAQCIDTDFCGVYLRKNGSLYMQSYRRGPSAANDDTETITTIVDMNGTTDYLEAQVYNEDNTSISGSVNRTTFSGAMISTAVQTAGGWDDNGAYVTLTDNTDFLGVGTSTPQAKLDIYGTGISDIFALSSSTSTRLLTVDKRGYLGLGATAPLTNLDITGNLAFSGASRYLNFGATSTDSIGSTGYGFRDNAGTLEFKNADGDWTGVGSGSGSVTDGVASSSVAFSVHKNGTDQTVSAGVSTVTTWNTEDYDTNNNFDLSTERFTPTVAGKYIITFSAYCPSPSTSCYATVAKNGTSIKDAISRDTSGVVNVVTIVDMNGITDYIDLLTTVTGGTTINGSSRYTYAQGALIAPSNGLAGGWSNNGTSSYLADYTDNVGIGTSLPTQKLHIAGNARLEGLLYDADNVIGTPGMVLQTTATGTRWVATSSLNIASGASFSTSAELAALLSDETGSSGGGALAVFSNAPVFSGITQFATASSSQLVVSDTALFTGANPYLNFGTATGSTGYGFRDNAGTIEFKNLGGSWQSLPTGVNFSISSSTYTSDDTWNKPTNLSYVEVIAIGGGGSGARKTGASGNAGGGGGGGGVIGRIDASDLSSTESIAVGAGGVGQSTNSTNGNPGGNSSFGSFITAGGGGGGEQSGTIGSGGAGGVNTTAPNVAVVTATVGGDGGDGGSSTNSDGADARDGTVGTGGGGGASSEDSTKGLGGDASYYGGAGSAGSHNDGAGLNAGLYGGGSGGQSDTGASGDGGDGIVIVYEYIIETAGADLAELFPTNDQTLLSGELISFNEGTPVTVSRANANNKQSLAGIVSTAPGLLLGNGEGAFNQRMVALAGRVPTKVNLENGPIAIGDRIALSSEPGVGKKAKPYEPTVGVALESTQTQGKVEVFIDLQQGYDIDAITSSLFATGTTTSTSSQTIWEKIVTLTQGFIDGVLEVVGLRAREICLTDEEGETCITREKLDALLLNADIDLNDEPEHNTANEHEENSNNNNNTPDTSETGGSETEADITASTTELTMSTSTELTSTSSPPIEEEPEVIQEEEVIEEDEPEVLEETEQVVEEPPPEETTAEVPEENTEP